jgi:hypothetical protein
MKKYLLVVGAALFTTADVTATVLSTNEKKTVLKKEKKEKKDCNKMQKRNCYKMERTASL